MPQKIGNTSASVAIAPMMIGFLRPTRSDHLPTHRYIGMAARPASSISGSTTDASTRIGPRRNDRPKKNAVYQITVSTPATPNRATKMRFLLPG